MNANDEKDADLSVWQNLQLFMLGDTDINDPALDGVTKHAVEQAVKASSKDWQPMSTAPRDGTEIEVTVDDGHADRFWAEANYVDGYGLKGWFIDAYEIEEERLLAWRPKRGREPFMGVF